MRPVLAFALSLAACNGEPGKPTGTQPTTPTGGNPVDQDGDGYGVPGDCNDQDPTVHPTAEDPPYDGVDQDCREDSDYDVDLDGFDWDGVEGGDDCDDNNPEVHPGAYEVCNGYDDDCNGVIDGEDATGTAPWYPDLDGDGYGADGEEVYACEPPPDTISTPGDCDDADPDTYPGAPTLACDGADNDCNDATFEGGGALVEGDLELDLAVAVEATAEGAALTLCEGRNLVSALQLPRSITLQGQGSGLTVLDGQGGGSVLLVDTTSPVALSGMTVTGGAASQGGGLWIGPAAQVVGTDLVFEGNVAGEGGAIWLGAGASLDLADSSVVSNQGDPSYTIVSAGGGIATEDGGQLLFDSVVVQQNEADMCGGLDLRGGTLLDGAGTTEIIDNETLGLAGGGLCAVGSTLRGLVIAQNESLNASGGLDGADVTLESVEVRENLSGLSGAGASFTGLVTITDSTFTGNIAGIDAGGFYLYGSDSVLTITGSEVTSNSATLYGTLGGGALLFGGTLVSQDTDWGTGATDNVPADVSLLQGNQSYGYAGVASFTCTDIPYEGTCL
jgi:hypothetical protein